VQWGLFLVFPAQRRAEIGEGAFSPTHDLHLTNSPQQVMIYPEIKTIRSLIRRKLKRSGYTPHGTEFKIKAALTVG